MNKLYAALAVLVLSFSCTTSTKKEEESKVSTITGNEIAYMGDSIEMKGYLAYDQWNQEKVPGILVVHEWWGHNDYARKRAEMLAELGYVAIAVDMFGDGKNAAHPQEAGEFAMQVMSDMDGATKRFNAALDQLKKHPNVDPEKIGAIGYCFGGSVVLSMANKGMDLDAVVAFHSGVQLPVQPEEDGVIAKVLVCNGADDPFVSKESVDAFLSMMDEANADYEYIDYPDAVHAFTNPGADELGQKFELPLKYNAAADSLSWVKMKELFASVF